MSDSVFDALLRRLKAHREKFDLPQVAISFHGGEPTLVGKAKVERLARRARHVLGSDGVLLNLQTNGTLLDREWLDLFEKYRISYAVSLDGPTALNDARRKDARGMGTTDTVLSALEFILQHPTSKTLFAGLLAVITPKADGRNVLRYMHSIGVKKVDFLMPDLAWEAMTKSAREENSIGDFLCDAFDEWLLIDDATFDVRLFRQVMRALFGIEPTLDVIGQVNGSVIIVETDGGMVAHDVLRTCGPPWDRSVANVLEQEIATLMRPEFFPWATLADRCRSCDVLFACGGGFPTHRFDGKSFDNPSYYCEDLYRFIHHVARETARRVPPSEMINYPFLDKASSSACTIREAGSRAANRE